MNDKVTIITTLHSDARQPYLKRFLSYYEQADIPPNIIVADSSQSPISDKVTLDQLKATHVTYEKFSHDKRFENKLLEAFEKVKTPYVAICAEDDFITTSGISKSIQHLDKYSDTVAVYGYLIAFVSDENNISVKNASVMHEVKDDSINARLAYFISEYPSAPWSAIYRKSTLLKIFKLSLKNVDDHEFGELLPAFLTPVYGKIHSLKELYWVREYFMESTGQKEDLIVNPRLYNFVEDGSYFYKYKNFEQCMVKEICKNSDLDSIEAEELVSNSFDKYFLMRIGCSYTELRNKLFYKKFLKKTGLFSIAKLIKSIIKQSPLEKKPESRFKDDPLFPKKEWGKMKTFLERNQVIM